MTTDRTTRAMRPIAATHRPSRAGARRFLAAGVAVAMTIGAAAFVRNGPLAPLDRLLLDGLVRASSTSGTDSRTIVVDIDEVSLSAVGQWPWPRYRIAALIEKIAAARPAAIGLDILFSEPDRTSLAAVRETFRRDFGLDVAISGVPDGLSNNDDYLGETIANADVVASSYLYFDHVNRDVVPARPGVAFDGAVDALALPEATGILADVTEIANRTRTTGFMNNQLDDDGVLRRMPLLIRHDGVVHPNLALATAMRAIGAERGTIEIDRDGPTIRVGGHRIPIDDSGFATLRFGGGPRHYDAVSAVDVLAGRFDPQAFRGRMVFVGSSSVGLNDVHDTAVALRFPGLRIQAVAASNVVEDRFVRTPAWSGAAAIAASLVVGVAVALLFASGASVLAIVAGTSLAAAVPLAASIALYARSGSFVGVAAPVATAATLFVLFAVTRFALERRRATIWLRRLQNARQVTIESMASVAETRDPETGAHIKRTQHYVKAIAEELRASGRHAETLTDEYIELLFVSAPLHDIGKVGVPDHILLKPGRLTPDEFEIMKQHAEFGQRIILSSAKHIEGDNFLAIAGEIAATHHEKWDGTGYPRGLAGEAIPLSGRIMATADVYDALISRRCYKEPFAHDVATRLMREGRGTMFDPAVLDAFFRIEASIVAIAAEFRDEADESLADAKADVAQLPSDPPVDLVGSLVVP